MNTSSTSTLTDVNKKLPIRTKIGYSFGEIGSQCSWTLVSSYLTVFYTDVVGLAPAVISSILNRPVQLLRQLQKIQRQNGDVFAHIFYGARRFWHCLTV